MFLPFVLSILLSVHFDHSDWDKFLKKFVNDKGEVNYQAAKTDPSLLDGYLEILKAIPIEQFDDWPREERIAVLINAYNAGVIRSILKYYPTKTVMNIPGFWEQQQIQVGSLPKEKGGNGRPRSLNQVEGDLLTTFRDEKIIFALSKGAKGSPKLQREAYDGVHLDGQLYNVTRAFVNDSEKNPIDPVGKKVVLSRIFKWQSGTFMFNWGDYPEERRWDPQEMAVLSFFAHYLDDPQKVEFLKNGKYKVKFSIFDWDLNDWKTKS